MDPCKQYQSLFDRALDGIFQTSLDGRYININAALARMYGYESQADLMAAQPLLNGKIYVNPEKRQDILNQIKQQGYISNYELEVYRKDGSKLWISESCWPVYNEKGVLAHYEGFIKDVSDSKAIENALQRSELQSKAIITAIPDLMFRVSRDGIYLGYVNTNQFTDLLPTDYEPIDQHLSKYLPAEVANRHLKYLNKALSTGTVQIYEQRHAMDGHPQDEEVRVVPIDNNEALFIIRDISDRKQAENALRQKNKELEEALQQLQQAQVGLVQAEKMVVLGQLIAGIAHEINTPLGAIQASSGNAVNALESALPKLPELFQSLSIEQQQLVFALIEQSLHTTPILSAREKRQQRRILTKQLEAEGIHEARSLSDTLIDMGIHEHLEPYLPLLRSDNHLFIIDLAYDLARIKSNSRTIQMAVGRASNVVKALKSYAHQDHTNQKVTVQVTDSIETVLTLYHNQLKQGIEITRYYEDLPKIACYPDELSQIWTNLVQNSIQAMDGKGKLDIAVKKVLRSHTIDREEQPPGPYIMITMTDNGPGIPTDVVKRIFDPFFTTKAIGEGTGLGLNISQKIAQKHQGWIEVESIPGHTCFRICLPMETES